jgi:hypothetical protein
MLLNDSITVMEEEHGNEGYMFLYEMCNLISDLDRHLTAKKAFDMLEKGYLNPSKLS